MTTQHFPGKPLAGEYALYHESYISLVSQDDILVALDQQRRDTVLLLSSRSEQEGEFRYAPGKWSAKEVIGHICDAERIFAYIARFASLAATKRR